MLKRRTLLPVFIIVTISLALTGILFAQEEAAFAQVGTPAPIEEATPEPAEEAAPTEAAPTPAAVEEAAPAEEAAPTEAAPTTLPTTGMASDPLTIILVVVGTVVVLGTLSGYSARRKRTTQE
jgi:hypothetical protein